MTTITIQEFIKTGCEKLTAAGLPPEIACDPRIDCEAILQHVLKKNRAYLSTWPEKQLSESEASTALSFLERRKQGEPIAYILGKRGFWDFELSVNRSTLIPRPETELLVETAIDISTKQSIKNILDLGTGSGAIAIALAKEITDSNIIATDLFDETLETAKKNAKSLNIVDINFIQSDWFSEISNKKFNLIVSNPPYIEDDDPHLNQGDLIFEPKTALVSGKDGLKDIRIISASAACYLENNGWLLLEHGYNQSQQVREILESDKFSNVVSCKDIQGHERITIGQKILP